MPDVFFLVNNVGSDYSATKSRAARASLFGVWLSLFCVHEAFVRTSEEPSIRESVHQSSIHQLQCLFYQQYDQLHASQWGQVSMFECWSGKQRVRKNEYLRSQHAAAPADKSSLHHHQNVGLTCTRLVSRVFLPSPYRTVYRDGNGMNVQTNYCTSCTRWLRGSTSRFSCQVTFVPLWRLVPPFLTKMWKTDLAAFLTFSSFLLPLFLTGVQPRGVMHTLLFLQSCLNNQVWSLIHCQLNKAWETVLM